MIPTLFQETNKNVNTLILLNFLPRKEKMMVLTLCIILSAGDEILSPFTIKLDNQLVNTCILLVCVIMNSHVQVTGLHMRVYIIKYIRLFLC